MDHVQVDDIELVVAGGEASEALKPAKEVLDQVCGVLGAAVKGAPTSCGQSGCGPS